MDVRRPYDGELQMLVEEPRDASLEHLHFLRWLAERGRLEHPVAGPPRIRSAGHGDWASLDAAEQPEPGRASMPRWFGR